MLDVVTKDVVKDFDVVSAILEALEVRMLVCFSVQNEFLCLDLFVHTEFICSNRLMFVIYLSLLLLLKVLRRILMF